MIKIKWNQENESRMHVNTREGVTYLTYPEFDRLPGFVHAFSTRLGGVSEGIYSSMNLSFTRGDKDEAVRENYRRLADAVGFRMEDIVTSDTYGKCAPCYRRRPRKRHYEIKTVHRRGWDDHQCTGAGSCDILRGLCASVFYRSGAPRDRTFSFRMERNRGKDRRGHSSKNEGRIRL